MRRSRRLCEGDLVFSGIRLAAFPHGAVALRCVITCAVTGLAAGPRERGNRPRPGARRGRPILDGPGTGFVRVVLGGSRPMTGTICVMWRQPGQVVRVIVVIVIAVVVTRWAPSAAVPLIAGVALGGGLLPGAA